MRADLAKEIADVIKKLQPISKDFVVIGGVSTYLYDFHELADVVQIKTTYTQDIDIAVPAYVSKNDMDIEKDFNSLGYQKEQSFFIDSPKPLFKYTKVLSDGEIEVEFLVPLQGSEYDRKGKQKTVKEIAGGITAQQLRFLDILLDNPYLITLDNLSGDKTDIGIFVKIPSPENYIVHKFITLGRRTDQTKREKDAFYLFDVLNRFKSNREGIAIAVAVLIKKYIKIHDIRDFKIKFQKFFESRSSEGIVLFMSEYNRTYKEKFEITEEQVIAHFQDFINLIK